MIYLLYGNNDYQIDRRVNDLRGQFATKYGVDNIAAVDINATSGRDLMARLTGVSLFATHQMIIVKAVTALSEAWSLLETNLDFIPDETVVVLTHVKELSKVNNLTITKTFKKLKAVGATIEKYDLVKPRDIRSWLAGEVKSRHLAMDRTAQNRLIDLTTGDENQQARLATELDKLAVLDGALTTDVINQYVEPSITANTFGLYELIITGQINRAIQQLNQLSNQGENPNRFMGLLASQQLALVAALTGAKVKLSAYQLGLARDLVVQLGDRAIALKRVQQVAAALAELDKQIKLSITDEAWIHIKSTLGGLSRT